MKILVVNQPLNNRGDQAAHSAFMKSLTRAFPDYTFDVVFLNANKRYIEEIKYEAPNLKYINLSDLNRGISICIKISLMLNNFTLSALHPLLRKYIGLMKMYDSVICCPGGICMGGFMSWPHVWQLFAADKYGKPIYYWSRSIGPFSDEDFRHRIFKKVSCDLLKKMKYVGLRDDVSYQIAKEIGAECHRVIDSVFLCECSGKIPNEISNRIGQEYIVFVPNELTWHYKYSNIKQDVIDRLYAEILHMLIKKFPDRKIVMLPQLYYQKINDYKYFRKLSDTEGNPNIIVLEDSYSSDIQQLIIKNSKIVIGGRYHSIVFAINNEIPFAALSYEHKISGMLTLLGLEEQMYDINRYLDGRDDLEEAVSHISRIIDTGKNIRQEAEIARKIAADNFAILSDCIRDNKELNNA